MDSLDWDSSPVFMNTSSSWSYHQQPGNEESFMIYNSNGCFYSGEKLDLLDDLFNPIQKTKSEASTATTGSLESLDCLISATTSNTDTSVEDDGISMIFSDWKKLWNFSTDTNKKSNVQNQLKQGEDYCYFDLLRLDSSTTEAGFKLISENQPKPKRARYSSNINFQKPSSSISSVENPDSEAIQHIKEVIYREAALRPMNLAMEVVEKPKRKNVRISNDPQTVAARQRRERISERIRVLQRLVPGGSKMDTASMLDEAAKYLKFLRSQVKAQESLGHKFDLVNCHARNLHFYSTPFNHSFPMQTYLPLPNPNPIQHTMS